MSFTKTCRKLCCFIAFVLAFCFLVGCTTINPTPSERETNKNAAEEAVSEISKGLLWDPSSMNAITSSSLTLTTETKYDNVVISWESSEEDVIATDGSVTRLMYDDPRAVLVDGSEVIPVTLTATITGTYSYKSGEETITNEVKTTKEFNFTVKCLKPDTVGTVAECKAAAWSYIYETKGVQKALISDSNTTYNVRFTAIVTAKLLNGGKGLMVHDGTEGIYVYTDNANFEIGDTVDVVGNIYTYYGSLQVGSEITIKKVDAVEGMKTGEYREVSVQEWEDENKNVEEAVGYFGGKLLKVYAKLEKSSNDTTSDIYKLVDPYTGEVAWVYYKSYESGNTDLDAWDGKYVYIYGASYDRDSRLVKNHLLWNGKIEEAPAPELTDAEKVTIELAGISVPAEVNADFELAAGENYVWEVVSGAAIALDGNKATVTRGEEDEVVVLKVTVTIGSESASKEFEVKVPSAELNIITIAEAKELAGTTKDKYTSEKYYIQGTVTEVQNTKYGNIVIEDATGSILVYGTYSADGSTRYDAMEQQPQVGDIVTMYGILGYYNDYQMKNGWVAEYYDVVTVAEAKELGGTTKDQYTEAKYVLVGKVTEVQNTKYGNIVIEDATGSILVYGTYSADGKVRYDALEVKPVVGDTIVVYGILGYYNDSQMKNGWLLSVTAGSEEVPHEHEFVNGECACGEKDPDYVPSEIVKISIAEAIEIAGTDGTYTTEKYYVEGQVTGFYNTTYGNFYLTDGTNEICVYGLYSADGSVRYDAMEVKPVDGDTVVVYGVLGSYNGNPQFKNAWLIEHTASNETPEQPEKTEYTIAEALELADGAAVILKGTVDRVEAWNDQYGNMNFTLKDATGALYVYRVYTKVALGDIVTVEGTMATYNESRQIGQGATITITGHDSSYDVVVENAVTYDFSTYAVGTQYAQGEEHKLDENTTLTVNGGHLNGQVRIYAGSNVVLSSSKAMTTLSIYAGNKNTTLTVTASVDGETWVEIVVLSITSAYADHEIDLSGAAYKYVKLTADAQVRVKTATISYAE